MKHKDSTKIQLIKRVKNAQVIIKITDRAFNRALLASNKAHKEFDRAEKALYKYEASII